MLRHNSGSHRSSSGIPLALASQLLILNILLQTSEEHSSTDIASQASKHHGCSGTTAENILPTLQVLLFTHDFRHLAFSAV